MTLRSYIDLLWRRRWVIVLALLATAAAVYLLAGRLTPEYQATAIVQISTASSGDSSWVSPELQYSDRLTNSYIVLAQLESMQQRLRNDLSVEQLPEIEIDPVPNTELVQITVTSENPELAANAANAIADIFYTRAWTTAPGAVSDADDELNSLTPQLDTSRISIVEAAVVPEVSSSPDRRTLYVLGALVGIGAGLALAFVFEAMETRLVTTEAIQELTHLPVLGRIARSSGRFALQRGLVNADSIQGEAFRRVASTFVSRDGLFRNALQPATSGLTGKKVLITSAETQDGKSTVAHNLARDCALGGVSTVIVDANRHSPRLDMSFELPDDKRGLQAVFACQAEIGKVVVASAAYPRLFLVPSGPALTSVGQMLDRRRVADVLDTLASRFALVIVDGPSLLGSADTVIFASEVDDVVLVAQRSKTRRAALQKALSRLENIGANVIGLVVTNAERSDDDKQYLRSQKLRG